MKKGNFLTTKLVLHLLVVVALSVNLVFLFSVKSQAGATGDEELRIIFLTTPECEDCFDLEPFKEYFQQNGLTEDQFDEYGYDSSKGKRLVKNYEIIEVPTIIVNGNINGYAFMADLVENIGEIRGGAFVVTKLQPPYINIETGETKGLFDVIYLADKSCEECYDVKLNDAVFERLGLFSPQNKTELDIADDEGKALIDAYLVDVVPTVILKGDLESYESMQDIWSQVGTVEEDGAYVLRKGVESMGIYKRLPENEIIYPNLINNEE